MRSKYPELDEAIESLANCFTPLKELEDLINAAKLLGLSKLSRKLTETHDIWKDKLGEIESSLNILEGQLDVRVQLEIDRGMKLRLMAKVPAFELPQTPLTPPIEEALKLPSATELEGVSLTLSKEDFSLKGLENPFEAVLAGKTPRPFEIWSEGYRATGDTGYAQCHGTEVARSFEEACWKFFVLKASVNDKSNCYSFERNTYWGCQLFDNEAAARASFG